MLTSEHVRLALERIDLIKEVAASFRLKAAGEGSMADEAYLAWVNSLGEPCRSLSMPGALQRDGRPSVGVKIINANARNLERGKPRASGLLLLFDERTAEVRCVMPAEGISAARTAAVSRICVDRLRVPDGYRLGIVGCGVQGAAHLDLLSQGDPAPGEVWLFDTRPAQALALERRFREREPTRAPAQISASAPEVLARADVVVFATTVTAPYVGREDVRKGHLLINVSLDDLDESVYFDADSIIVDDEQLIEQDEKRILGKLMRSGKISRKGYRRPGAYNRIDCWVEDLLLREQGVHEYHAEALVVVNPFGLAIEDLAVGSAVFEVCEAQGWGVDITQQ